MRLGNARRLPVDRTQVQRQDLGISLLGDSAQVETFMGSRGEQRYS